MMEFGIPKEVRDLESRVSVTPAGVGVLVDAGHSVYVERSAGSGAGFSDRAYTDAGAQLVYSAAELYGRSDVVVKVTRPTAAEHAHFRHRQTIFSFLHLPVSSPDLARVLVEKQITAIAYEMIQENDGTMPVLLPMSEIAGRLAPIIAGQLLMTTNGGRGTLLSGIPGVPAAAVVIIGAGVLGCNAARGFLGAGSQVTLIDTSMRKLQHADQLLQGRVMTMVSTAYNIRRTTRFADVVLGAVLRPGRRAPVVVTRDMVANMRPGSVIVDYSIDQGGCVETSRPTTLRAPTYVEEGVIHYCVPNLTATVARTTSHAMTNAAVPFLLAMEDFPDGLRNHPALARGVNLYKGRMAHPLVAAALGVPVDPTLPDYLVQGGVEL
ncbi:MAG: alanine dehydrogenase [Anaerolineae bacterium]|nr:alanine dehydrogenase [Anaerolineae bacterium]